jgi:hypothetical protein
MAGCHEIRDRIHVRKSGLELDGPSRRREAIECKWIYKKKTNADGNVHVYKARIVARDGKKNQGVDYDDTFSLVAMLKSSRVLIVIAAYFDYEIWQMDFKTTFLNGMLSKDVYMIQPEGFVDPANVNKVCKLQCSMDRSKHHKVEIFALMK